MREMTDCKREMMGCMRERWENKMVK